MKLYITPILLLFFVCSFGQTVCDVMFDAIELEDGIMISAQVPAGDVYNNPDKPVFAKLDVNGQQIWRIEDQLPTPYYNLRNIKLFDFGEPEIYAILDIPETHQNSTPFYQVWKVSIADGTILWKGNLHESAFSKPYGLIDYGGQVIVYQSLPHISFSETSGFEVYTIDKVNGNETLIHNYSDTQILFNFAKDSKNNFYYTFQLEEVDDVSYGTEGTVIRKIGGLNFNAQMWEKQYLHYNGEATLPSVSRLIIDEFDNLYAFSGEDNVDLFKINTDDGSEIWRINNVGAGIISDVKFNHDYLYVSFRHQYVGSATTYFTVSKIDLNTGSTEWTSYLEMTVQGSPSSSTGSNEGILAFDFDCNNDIYATGYYGSANYAPGAWGIMKISDVDGSKINDLTVTLDETIIDNYSVGTKAFVIDGVPTFLGNLQDLDGGHPRAFVTTDTDLTNIIDFVDLCTNLSLSAETPDETGMGIELYPNPTSSTVYINKNELEIESVSLYTITGAEVITIHKNIDQLDLSRYQSGVYILKIRTKDAETVRKVIKYKR